jgi:hypothetical protein
VNRNTVIGLVGLIAVLPLIYVIDNALFPVGPEYGFRGRAISPVTEANGIVTVPTLEDDAKGAMLHAVFKPAFLEKLAGAKPPNPSGLDLMIDNSLDTIGACTPDGKIPAHAGFTTAKSCADADFAAWKMDKKGAVLVDPALQMIVFGATGNNLVRVYHNGLIASYVSPDMVQTDRKKEACIVVVALDHLMGAKPNPDANCATLQ